ncbi:sensor histidine kinase [Kribbella catacumbae]|uniref:sensor histidine kinase n=1 Tax=Kribbella catacumbae TaxID=460086 RepID=UPI0003742D41|nr:HAMP domain-containing sensor histidine kinase [Kribbella catacumbae]
MSAVSAPESSVGEGSPAGGPDQLMRLCHDLRQYVAAGLLLSEPRTGQEAQTRMALIHQQFTAIAEMLAAEFDRVDSMGPINLARLVTECADMVRLTHRGQITVMGSKQVLVDGEQALLRRAVGNMLDNACRAAGPSGTVTVKVGVDAHEAKIEVVDDGAGFGGISAGTGHGLQVIAAAVRACRGRLEISSGPGVGTTVRLCVPALRRAVRPA